MADRVTVIARVQAKPGQEQRVHKELFALLAPTRAEEGYLNYDMHQSVENPASFLFHENWTSEALLKQHLGSPHIQHWITISGELLAEPIEITLWKPVG